MGFRLIVRRLMQYQPQIPEVREIFGPRFACAHQAHLLSANGVGIELFQFLDPPVVAQDDNFQHWRTGIFHLCVTIRPRRTGGADRRGRRTSANQNLDLLAGASLSARLLRRPVRNHHRGLLPLLRGAVLEHARLGVRPAAGADWVSRSAEGGVARHDAETVAPAPSSRLCPRNSGGLPSTIRVGVPANGHFPRLRFRCLAAFWLATIGVAYAIHLSLSRGS